MKPVSRTKPTATREGVAAVNAYLASQPSHMRAALQKLRKAIVAAAPNAKQSISYGMPAFKVDGRPLVWIAAFKEHCSLFPGPSAIRLHAADLKAYKTSKGTIQFSPDSPLPMRLVAKLVKARMAEMHNPRRRK